MTTSNGFASRDDFLCATQRRFDEVPLWNGKKARIRSIDAGEWLDVDVKNYDTKRGGLSATGVRMSDMRLLIASVCDSDGQPIFTEADLPKLERIDASVLLPVLKKIRTHCGIKDDIEGVIKNSETTGGYASHSSSAEPSPTT